MASMVDSKARVPRVCSSSTALTVFSREVTFVTITWTRREFALLNESTHVFSTQKEEHPRDNKETPEGQRRRHEEATLGCSANIRERGEKHINAAARRRSPEIQHAVTFPSTCSKYPEKLEKIFKA